LIRIFEAIHNSCPDSKLLLVGTGTLEKKIRALTSQLSLDDSVIFAGSHSDVYRYYQAMDVFMLPSFYEGLPLVLMEAQASGLPCFASDKVVAPECKITELMHFIPLEHTPKQWADEILKMVSEQGPRTDHSEEVKAAGFDICSTTEELCDFYRKVLSEHDR
jgi:glycosyltransferase involved in cell wall biosynthesis